MKFMGGSSCHNEELSDNKNLHIILLIISLTSSNFFLILETIKDKNVNNHDIETKNVKKRKKRSL